MLSPRRSRCTRKQSTVNPMRPTVGMLVAQASFDVADCLPIVRLKWAGATDSPDLIWTSLGQAHPYVSRLHSPVQTASEVVRPRGSHGQFDLGIDRGFVIEGKTHGHKSCYCACQPSFSACM